MIRKLRSIEETNEAQRTVPETDPPHLIQRVSALFAFVNAFGLTRFRGVHKFRNIEESNEFRKTWMRDRAVRSSPPAAPH